MSDHEAMISLLISPEHLWQPTPEELEEMEPEFREGPHLIPEMCNWTIMCPEHRYYVPVSMPAADLERFTVQTAEKLLRAHRDIAQRDFMQDGCGAHVPNLPLPARMGHPG